MYRICCIDDDPIGSEASAGKQSFKLAVPVVPDSDEMPDWRWLPVEVVTFPATTVFSTHGTSRFHIGQDVKQIWANVVKPIRTIWGHVRVLSS